jgi:hypothetical protein
MLRLSSCGRVPKVLQIFLMMPARSIRDQMQDMIKKRDHDKKRTKELLKLLWRYDRQVVNDEDVAEGGVERQLGFPVSTIIRAQLKKRQYAEKVIWAGTAYS